MPAGDRTGPMGMGPMTGRAAGYCAGYPVPGYLNPVGGRGLGFGRGYGRGLGMGWGRGARWGGYYPTPYSYGMAPVQPTPKEEKNLLDDQMKMLQREMDAIKKRIEELGKQEKE